MTLSRNHRLSFPPRVAGSILVITALLVVLLGITVTGLARLALLDRATATLEVQHAQARALAEAGLQWGLQTGTNTPGAITLGDGTFELERTGDLLVATGRVGQATARLSCAASVTCIPHSRQEAGGTVTWRAVNLLARPCRIDAVRIEWTGTGPASAAQAAARPEGEILRLVGERDHGNAAIHSGDLLWLVRSDASDDSPEDDDEGEEHRGNGGGGKRHKIEKQDKGTPRDGERETIELAPFQEIEIVLGPFSGGQNGHGGGHPGLLSIAFHTQAGFLPTSILPR